MSVNVVTQALGTWDVSLAQDIPRDVLDQLRPMGHIVVVAGRVDPAQYGDNLLSTARFVGPLRKWEITDEAVSIAGVGMTFWLGDEDQKGQVIENTISGASATFANAVRAVMPTSVTEGTLFSVPGVANYSFVWKSPREALDSLCDIYGTPTFPVEYRVNGDGSLDAGRVDDLYNPDPVCVIIAKDAGYDLDLKALPGKFDAARDVEDFSTRVVAMGQGDGGTISASGANLADIGKSNPYLDLFGQPVHLTRLVDASDVENTNLYNLAAQQLGRFASTNDALTLSASDYDISGDVNAGDYVWAYDPDSGLFDTGEEMYFRGQRLNPVKLRVLELTWAITVGMTVAFRTQDGDWLDLTDYVNFESDGDTSLKVAGYDRSLTSSVAAPPGDRVNGDTSVPGVPVFGDFSAGTYQNAQDETKAQILVTWSQPLNTDGSTIVDGDHYEIRWRPNATLPYPATWNEAGQNTWNEVFTWNQPRVPAITDTDWHILYAPWDADQFLLQELTPSVEYEFQIRAVDTASPANQSAWSGSQLFTAPRDTRPPSTPAVASVAGSRIAVQVTHHLGVSTGGTFNLEPDTNHLEVHVSNNPTYFPDDTTLVGRLLCAAALQSQVPVVATFPVEETTERYVKVIAVDRSGNKSPASDAATATALLIDDLHVSDLSVTKLTAGTLQADVILGASIRTATDGERVELTVDGLQAYGPGGDQTINLAADPDANGNFLTFQRDGVALASISEDGNIGCQDLNVIGDLTIDGDDFFDDLYDPLPKGEMARGSGTDVVVGSGANTEKGYIETAFTAEAGRRYRVAFHGYGMSNTTADFLTLTLRDGGASVPLTSSTLLMKSTATTITLSVPVSTHLIYEGEFTAGVHRLLIGFLGVNGTATMKGDTAAYQMFIDDVGPSLAASSQVSDGTGGATPPPQNYTKTYTATWHASYRSDGSFNGFAARLSNVIQGDSQTGVNGNQRGLIGFDFATIQADLAGATITSASVTLNFEHWYDSSGGTAVIGTHNYGSKPSTWADASVNQDRLTSASWPNPGKRTVSLGTTIGNEFKSGVSTGIALGPGINSTTTYYGYASGSGTSNPPVLTIQYTK